MLRHEKQDVRALLACFSAIPNAKYQIASVSERCFLAFLHCNLAMYTWCAMLMYTWRAMLMCSLGRIAYCIIHVWMQSAPALF